MEGNSDFVTSYTKMNRKDQNVYFSTSMYPKIRNFIEYLIQEAHGYKKNIDEGTLYNTIPFTKNEVIEACTAGYDFQMKSSKLNNFWKRLMYNLSFKIIAASSFNIRTVRFANHFHNHPAPRDSKFFINLFSCRNDSRHY